MKTLTGALIVLALSLQAPLDAQEGSRPVRVFLTTGAGFGSHFTPHASVSLAHRTGEYMLRGALAYAPDVGGFGFGGGGSAGPWGGPRQLTEVSLLYGGRKAWGATWARGAVGVGYVDAAQLDPVAPGEEPETNAIGLAAQVDLVWAPVPTFGIGMTGVGDLNDLRTLAAVTLSVHVGRVR